MAGNENRNNPLKTKNRYFLSSLSNFGQKRSFFVIVLCLLLTSGFNLFIKHNKDSYLQNKVKSYRYLQKDVHFTKLPELYENIFFSYECEKAGLLVDEISEKNNSNKISKNNKILKKLNNSKKAVKNIINIDYPIFDKVNKDLQNKIKIIPNDKAYGTAYRIPLLHGGYTYENKTKKTDGYFSGVVDGENCPSSFEYKKELLQWWLDSYFHKNNHITEVHIKNNKIVALKSSEKEIKNNSIEKRLPLFLKYNNGTAESSFVIYINKYWENHKIIYSLGGIEHINNIISKIGYDKLKNGYIYDESGKKFLKGEKLKENYAYIVSKKGEVKPLNKQNSELIILSNKKTENIASIYFSEDGKNFKLHKVKNFHGTPVIFKEAVEKTVYNYESIKGKNIAIKITKEKELLLKKIEENIFNYKYHECFYEQDLISGVVFKNQHKYKKNSFTYGPKNISNHIYNANQKIEKVYAPRNRNIYLQNIFKKNSSSNYIILKEKILKSQQLFNKYGKPLNKEQMKIVNNFYAKNISQSKSTFMEPKMISGFKSTDFYKKKLQNLAILDQIRGIYKQYKNQREVILRCVISDGKVIADTKIKLPAFYLYINHQLGANGGKGDFLFFPKEKKIIINYSPCKGLKKNNFKYFVIEADIHRTEIFSDQLIEFLLRERKKPIYKGPQAKLLKKFIPHIIECEIKDLDVKHYKTYNSIFYDKRDGFKTIFIKIGKNNFIKKEKFNALKPFNFMEYFFNKKE